MFGTDRVMLYNVEPWASLGFGVPNFGENVGTLNNAIAGLVDEIGKSQLYIMLSSDAMRWKPPSPNTVQRIAKLVTRVQTVLGGRSTAYNILRTESGHATPAAEIFRIHPVPYFDSDILRNRWLKEYNNLVMVGLANLMQHSDSNIPLTITQDLAQDVFIWFKRIRVLLATELLLIDPVVASADNFVFTQAHFDAYDPMRTIMNMEAFDTPGPIFGLPTEDDVRPLFVGIPANQIAPLLTQAPLGPGGPVAGGIPASGFVAGTSGAAGATPAAGNVGSPPPIATPGV